jgi:hypothetical protein
MLNFDNNRNMELQSSQAAPGCLRCSMDDWEDWDA